MPKYCILLEQEKHSVIAKCPELGIVSQGSTEGTALDNIKEAIELLREKKSGVKPKTSQSSVIKSVNIATIEVP